jgi:hypothetical protein
MPALRRRLGDGGQKADGSLAGSTRNWHVQGRSVLCTFYLPQMRAVLWGQGQERQIGSPWMEAAFIFCGPLSPRRRSGAVGRALSAAASCKGLFVTRGDLETGLPCQLLTEFFADRRRWASPWQECWRLFLSKWRLLRPSRRLRQRDIEGSVYPALERERVLCNAKRSGRSRERCASSRSSPSSCSRRTVRRTFARGDQSCA